MDNHYGRHSIDNVTGRPIYIEDYVIPVYKGSTLITEFEFPFDLTAQDEISVTLGNPETLNEATIVKTGTRLATIRWEDDVIADLATTGINTFRVRVENSSTGIVRVYNEIKIKLV